MKNKLLITGLAVYLLSGAAAFAGGLDVQLNIGQPAPVYVAPAPYMVSPPPAVYVAPYPEYYDPHHRRHDWRYWHDRREREMHEHWDHR